MISIATRPYASPTPRRPVHGPRPNRWTCSALAPPTSWTAARASPAVRAGHRAVRPGTDEAPPPAATSQFVQSETCDVVDAIPASPQHNAGTDLAPRPDHHSSVTSATVAVVQHADEKQSFDDFSIRSRTDLTRAMWRAGTADVAQRLCLPEVDERAEVQCRTSSSPPTEPDAVSVDDTDCGTAVNVELLDAERLPQAMEFGAAVRDRIQRGAAGPGGVALAGRVRSGRPCGPRCGGVAVRRGRSAGLLPAGSAVAGPAASAA